LGKLHSVSIFEVTLDVITIFFCGIKIRLLGFRFVVMKQINPKHRAAVPKFRALTSLNQFRYERLLEVFDRLVISYLSQYTLKGKRRSIPSFKESKNSSLYGSIAKLDFMLLFLKENPTQSYHGCFLELSQSKVSEWFSLLLPLLRASLDELNLMAGGGEHFAFKASEDADYLDGDVIERQTPRLACRKAQKEEYSGDRRTARRSYTPTRTSLLQTLTGKSFF
jgi:hypothetical protein